MWLCVAVCVCVCVAVRAVPPNSSCPFPLRAAAGLVAVYVAAVEAFLTLDFGDLIQVSSEGGDTACVAHHADLALGPRRPKAPQHTCCHCAIVDELARALLGLATDAITTNTAKRLCADMRLCQAARLRETVQRRRCNALLQGLSDGTCYIQLDFNMRWLPVRSSVARHGSVARWALCCR